MNKHTSSATNFDIFEDIRIAREQREKQIEAKKQEIMREKAKYDAKRRLISICTIAIVFVIAFTVLSRNAQIIQSTSKIETLSKELEDAKSTNVKKELALEKSLDLSYIEEVATRKLGMKRPDKFQTVYVDVTQNNYAEMMSVSNKDDRFYGAFSVIVQDALNIVEYLQ